MNFKVRIKVAIYGLRVSTTGQWWWVFHYFEDRVDGG
ncbi:hypothetical protein M2419_005611 [Sphingobacterium sp. BIGb0116]|nr:hypothetical protein [Sphingobacterium sp. BIGb0116]